MDHSVTEVAIQECIIFFCWMKKSEISQVSIAHTRLANKANNLNFFIVTLTLHQLIPWLKHVGYSNVVWSLSLLRFFSVVFERKNLQLQFLCTFSEMCSVFHYHFSQTDKSHPSKLPLTFSLLVEEAQWTQSLSTGLFCFATSIGTQLLTHLLSLLTSWLCWTQPHLSPFSRPFRGVASAVAHGATSGSHLFKAKGHQWWDKENYNVQL